MRRVLDLLPIDPKTCLFAGAFSGEISELQKSNRYKHVYPLGIGNLDIVFGLLKYRDTHPEISSVVFLGSAGAYEWAKLPTLSILPIHSVGSFEVSSALGESKQTPNQLEVLRLNNPLENGFVCNAPASITLRNLVTPPNSDWNTVSCENLELYGLTKVCRHLSLDLYAFLVITNTVGPNGSAEWQKNWKEGSLKLQEYVNSLV